jgi:3'-5' exoribonuclease
MDKIYISELSEGEGVTSFFLVRSKQILTTKTDKPYLSLTLQDRTGNIPARVWDNAAEFVDKFKLNDVIKVDAAVDSYNGQLQLIIRRLRPAEESEFDLSDFVPHSAYDIDEMFLELCSLIESIENPHLRALLGAFFEDEEFTVKFKASSAAKNIHHVCVGGLLEHTLSTARLCEYLTTQYESLDSDLLITMAMLHDIGKIRELEGSPSINYTDEGNLLGHITLGIQMVGEMMGLLPDFPPNLRLLVEHMILSHHGQSEWGSPRKPMFLEAEVLHRADDMDVKVDIITRALAEDRDPDSPWTSYHRALERILYKKPGPGTPDAPDAESSLGDFPG